MVKKILIIIDEIELKYFEFNDLVTDFWFIKEYLLKGYTVDVAVKNGLFIKDNTGYVIAHKSFEKDGNIFYDKDSKEEKISSYDIVHFRPDPPVDIDYINACYIFDFVDTTRTKIINNPRAVLDFNEKMHGNLFPKYIPQNIITANNNQIKQFVYQRGEAIVKPLNRCFGSGIFYLKQGDKNLNSLINQSTNGGKTHVCVQEYLGHGQGGDKRAFIVGKKVYRESLRKFPGKDDFRFNTHSDEYFGKEYLTDREYEAALDISKYLTEQGIYLAALDLIDEKVTEINVTSPCYFFREMNRLHEIQFHKLVMEELAKITEETTVV